MSVFLLNDRLTLYYADRVGPAVTRAALINMHRFLCVFMELCCTDTSAKHTTVSAY
jgi:hypothetical protein